MRQEDFDLLRALCENSAFQPLLKAMIDESREKEMLAVESAHMAQNQTAASLSFGRLMFMEELPSWFQTVYREQKRKRNLAE